ncbi:MAG: aminoacyl-tRNA deacylase [Vicinamibacterales bacterium]
MKLHSYLDRMGVPYQISHHDTAYTAQQLAQAEHVPGMQVIKPVLVEADGRPILCALPAPCKIDLDRLRDRLHARQVRLADESRMAELFDDCEPGAEPPIGLLWGVPTVMDQSLCMDDHVTFQAGTHQEAVTMRLEDFQRIAQPDVIDFSKPA